MEKRVSYYSSTINKGNLGTKDTPFPSRHLRPQLSAEFSRRFDWWYSTPRLPRYQCEEIKISNINIPQSGNQTHNRRVYRYHDGPTYYLRYKNNVKI